MWVVRKGATPAFPGQRGFVGGSMGDISVIIEGVENESANLREPYPVNESATLREPKHWNESSEWRVPVKQNESR